MTNPITLPDGIKEWRNKKGEFHRDDGPAIIGLNGTKYWYINGKRHRDGGPALIHPDGRQEWYQNGKCHRDDGPAIIWPDGRKEWFLRGQKYTFKKWLQLVLNKISIIWKHQYLLKSLV
jgi:hypothetical protein